MASMRDIKRRKESVQSTQQITKAMKLVSTVKLQKARGRAESNKPYFNMLYDTICSILAMTKEPNHKFLKEKGSYRDHIEPWTCRWLQQQCCKGDCCSRIFEGGYLYLWYRKKRY